jgi:hypothetical protein
MLIVALCFFGVNASAPAAVCHVKSGLGVEAALDARSVPQLFVCDATRPQLSTPTFAVLF